MKNILLVIVLLLGVLVGLSINFGNQSRYTIVEDDGMSILLDTKTGFTWQNADCGDKKNCWQHMKHLDEVIPIGEKRLRK